SPQKLHTALALLPVDDGQREYLFERLLDARPNEVLVLRDALEPHREEFRERLWAVVERSPGKESRRLRAASALAAYDPDRARWAGAGAAVADDLVTVPAVHLAVWTEALRPVSDSLLKPLSAIFHNGSRLQSERSLATDLLAEYVANRPEDLADLLM